MIETQQQQLQQQQQQQKNPDNTTIELSAQMKKVSNKIIDVYNVETKLNRGTFGIMPPILEKLFNEDYKNKIITKQHKRIKPGKNAFLRYGVEQTKHQQFLSIFADIYSAVHNLKREEFKTVQQIRQILKKELTIDIFVRLFNGSLIKTFYTKNKIVNVHQYRTSKIYKLMEIKNKNKKNLLLKIVISFENYMDYLMDETIDIDHTYLWDLFTIKSSLLQNMKFNLAIIDISNRDITQDVDFLCPKNSSSSFYNEENPTIFIIKKDTIYELIYNVIQTTNSFKITRWFKMDDALININPILKAINKHQKCKPIIQQQNYTFITPPSLDFLIENINKKGDYKIIDYVLHYNGKIIALMLQRNAPTTATKTHPFYLPCNPTAIPINDVTTTTIFIDEVKWIPFNELIEEYELMEKLVPEIQIKLKFRVLDDGLVVGILTNTDQFIQLSRPIQLEDSNSNPPLTILNSSNYISADMNFFGNTQDGATTDTSDKYTEREMMVKFIYLETKFYMAFRNIVKRVLNDYEHRKKILLIYKLISNNSLQYSEKFKKIRSLLVKLKLNVKFANIEESVLLEIDIDEPITNLIQEVELAMNVADSNIELIIPKYNLVTELDNKDIYYNRVTDEIIRFPQIRKFLLNEDTILFDTIDDEYFINNNEFILLEDDKIQYFSDLLNNKQFGNKYSKNNLTNEYANTKHTL
jgi:hypothetical protein